MTTPPSKLPRTTPAQIEQRLMAHVEALQQRLNRLNDRVALLEEKPKPSWWQRQWEQGK